jgi:hypothetical protein
MVIRYLMLLAAVLVLCASCVDKGQDDAVRSSEAAKAAADMQEADDPIAVSLEADLPDERHLAMLAIASFELDGYQGQLAELAAEDPVACITLAAVNDDPAAMVAYYETHATGQVDALLGAALGLSCVARVPSSAWEDIIALAAEEELDQILWGLAQLDIEPGGPLAKSGLLEKQLADLHNEADAVGNLTRRAAIDALLGVSDSRSIDWQVYFDYATNATWNAVQWRALLRWADAGTWRTMLGLPGLHENTRAVLAEALIAGGPDISLPGIPGQWLALGVDLEVRANEFMTGKVETISMPELARVLVPVESPEGDGSSSNTEPEMNLHKGNLGTVLVLFRYALIRGDSQAQQAVLDLVPKLPEEGRNAVLAMLMRTRPSVLTDEQLHELLALNDRSLGYYLLMGWHDRALVQESGVANLVRVSPSRENVLVAEAYRQWLAGRQEPSAND